MSIEIPYYLLKEWHGKVEKSDPEATTPDYISLVNELIPGHCAQIHHVSGQRISSNLAKKAGSVKAKYRNAKNSRERNQLDQKTLKVNIFEHELVSMEGIEDELMCTRQEIEEWKKMVVDLEGKKKQLVTDMNEALKEKDIYLKEKDEEISQLKEKNQELIQHIEKLEERLGEVGCTGKKLGDLGPRQRSRKLKELKSRAEVALWFVKSYGLELNCLKGVDTNQGNQYTIELDKEDSSIPNTDKEEDNKLEQVLYLLDKFCASDELYHELTMICDDLPKSYLIKQKRNQLNNICNIEPVPGQYPGAQISFTETLKSHVKELLQTDPSHDMTEPIKVKISGDGAKMSRSTNFMILSFCLLQTGEKVMSSKANRTIAIVNGPEKYETLKQSFSSAINEINTVLETGFIEVDGKEIKIEMFLGGDYKFLLMVMGLSSATSTHACLWCLIHKLDRWDTSKPIEHYQSVEMKRTLAHIKSMLPLKKFSVINQPLFNIELDHVILDELHLMMRVTDRLTENIISEVMERDSQADISKARGEKKGVYLDTLVNTIKGIGISFSIWEKKNADGKGSGSYDWTSLIGSDKKKLMELLPAQLEEKDILFPETKDTVIQLWSDFHDLYKTISDYNTNAEQYLDVSQRGKNFINLFCSLADKRIKYGKDRVTPYMHTLPYHVPLIIHRFSTMKQFTGQGVEKNNDDAKRIFFQKSNKWDAARDVLLLESRQLALQSNDREKRKYTKTKDDYWDEGIVETRKKRQRSQVVSTETSGGDPGPSSATNDGYEEDLTKLNVKQLREKIKSKNIQVKGLAKLKKWDLIKVIKNSH